LAFCVTNRLYIFNFKQVAGIKKTVYKLLICALLLVCIDKGVGVFTNYCVKHVKRGDLYNYKYMFLQAKPAIAILGSSRAKHHYVTAAIQKQYGLKTLNYGFDGSGVFLYYITAKNIIKHNTPQFIIVDIKPDEFSGAPDANWLENFYPLKDSMDISPADLDVVSPFEQYKLMSHTYRVNNQFVEMLQSLGGTPADTALIDGYASVPTKATLQAETLAIEEYNAASANYLVEIIKLCRQHNIKVVVCTSPHYFKFSHSRTMDETAKICREYNVQYLNYTNNAIIPFNSNDFSDVMHLNTAGAEKFTKDLLGRIK